MADDENMDATYYLLCELLEEANNEGIYDNENLADFLIEHGVTIKEEED